MEEDNSNIILGGDFNLILHANEKCGGSFMPDPFRNQMENIMQTGDLIDITPKNRKYTWSNHRLGSSNIMERLDWFLVNISLLSTFSVVNSSIFPFAASDHYLITLALDIRYPLSPLPFKYNHIWSDYQAARNIIQHTWGQHIEGSPELQCAIEQKEYYQNEKVQEEELYNQLSRIKREEEEKWRIKSRQMWLESRDKNTSLFHKQATARQIRNTITAIVDSVGTQHTEQADIKGAATDHFKELLTETKEEELYDDLL
eukprot:PITA_16082